MRKFVLSAMALAMTVVLVGCGGDDKPKTPATTGSAAPATAPSTTK